MFVCTRLFIKIPTNMPFCDYVWGGGHVVELFTKKKKRVVLLSSESRSCDGGPGLPQPPQLT